MKKDKLYHLLVSKMQEASVVPPQEVGIFTPFYKKIVPQLKIYPWKLAIIFSIISAFMLYFLFGKSLIKAVSLLQIGF
jgi:hypothetical protein